jgi:hypothetical protein
MGVFRASVASLLKHQMPAGIGVECGSAANHIEIAPIPVQVAREHDFPGQLLGQGDHIPLPSGGKAIGLRRTFEGANNVLGVLSGCRHDGLIFLVYSTPLAACEGVLCHRRVSSAGHAASADFLDSVVYQADLTKGQPSAAGRGAEAAGIPHATRPGLTQNSISRTVAGRRKVCPGKKGIVG